MYVKRGDAAVGWPEPQVASEERGTRAQPFIVPHQVSGKLYQIRNVLDKQKVVQLGMI